jgi:chemotaxis protein methyltransferase CheR
VPLPPGDFQFVQSLVLAQSALVLGAGKEYLVEARLAPLAEREGLSSVAELIERLRRGPAALRDDVVEAMTTNETSFFRDLHPFDALREVVLPAALERTGGRLRLWSAAASTGQEAYSLAMLLADHFGSATASILATDLSRTCSRGRRADVQPARGEPRLPAPLLVRHFERDGAGWRLRERCGAGGVPAAEPGPPVAPLPKMDVVLLRNVLIYFGAEGKRAVLTQMAACWPGWSAVPRRCRDDVRAGRELGAAAGGTDVVVPAGEATGEQQ